MNPTSKRVKNHYLKLNQKLMKKSSTIMRSLAETRSISTTRDPKIAPFKRSLSFHQKSLKTIRCRAVDIVRACNNHVLDNEKLHLQIQ